MKGEISPFIYCSIHRGTHFLLKITKNRGKARTLAGNTPVRAVATRNGSEHNLFLLCYHLFIIMLCYVTLLYYVIVYF